MKAGTPDGVSAFFVSGGVHSACSRGLRKDETRPAHPDRVAAGEPVLVDYLVMYDSTDPRKPGGMVVILRFPNEFEATE